MINQMFLNLIITIHLIFVVFVIVTPFIGNNYFLILHAITIPFMMAHWYLNDNNCALTIMEKQLRQSIYGEIPDPDDCFTHNLISPIYDFKKNNQDISLYIYIITIALWSYSCSRLYINWTNGRLSRLDDMINY